MTFERILDKFGPAIAAATGTNPVEHGDFRGFADTVKSAAKDFTDSSLASHRRTSDGLYFAGIYLDRALRSPGTGHRGDLLDSAEQHLAAALAYFQ